LTGDDLCFIKITSIKLRGLKSGALFGSANPYVIFNLGPHRDKTTVIWGKKADWCWKSTAIVFRSSLSKLQNYKLVVRVYDKERIRRKRMLGAVSVKLAGLEVNGIQSWFALEGGDSGNGGDVFLSIQLTYT
jgi:hypothetical protein